MGNDNLKQFAQDLSDDFGTESGVWSEFSSLITDLKGEVDDDERQEFRDCADSDDFNGYDTLKACMLAAAENAGVRESFRRRINRNSDLLTDLKSAGISAAASNNVSEEVLSEIDRSELQRLNKMCANGMFGDVEDDLSDDMIAFTGVGSIDSYTDCVTATSEISGLREDLDAAYNT